MKKRISSFPSMSFLLLALVSGCICPTPSGNYGTPTPRTSVPWDMPITTPSPFPLLPADVIFYNGNTITMNDQQPQAQAIAIAGERIVAVGANEEVLTHQGSATQLIDLEGKTVMPGFIDDHSHRMTQKEKWGFSTFEEAGREAVSQGWTGLDELMVTPDNMRNLLEADGNGEINIRLNLYLAHNSFEGEPFGEWYEEYQPGQQISPHLRIAGIKIFIDYNSGRVFFFSQDELNQLVSKLHSEGWQVSMKAISIQSHELALRAIEYALQGQDNWAYRHRIEHSIAVTDEQLAFMAEKGIIPCIESTLPGAMAYDPDIYHMAEENGYENSYRWKDYYDGGVFMTASPLNPPGYDDEQLTASHMSPMGVLYRSVTQIGPGNLIPEPWMLENALSVEQLLPLLTINGAYITFGEDNKGSLVPGKWADLVIFSDNPLAAPADQLLEITTFMTMIGGKVEYCAAGFESLCPDVGTTLPTPPSDVVTPLPTPFTGEWEGADPVDGSVTTLSMTQTGNSLTSTFKDTFSPNVAPPGYEGNGSGVVLSDTTAQITFDLSRWDGKTVQWQLFLTLSDQNNTLTLDCEVGCPIVLQRQ